MKIIETNLPDIVVIEPHVFDDSRGFFLETYQSERYREMGIPLDFVQDNLSRSTRGVLRGLHYQLPHAQGKLVYVTRGAVLDVAVDIRHGSPTFGEHVAVELSDQNHRQIYVPPGFAHGFCVLSDVVDFVYKCTDYYTPEAEKGIQFDDPALGIDWPVTDPVLSEKDREYLCLADLPEEDLPRHPSLCSSQ